MQERRRTLAVLIAGLAVAILAVAEVSALVVEPDARTAVRTFSPRERQRLTAIVEQAMIKERIPGLNVGIWIPGRGTWVRSFGTANLKTGSPMRVAGHVRIASITKTFTATATLQLVDQGRLGLDDTLSSYIEGIPYGDQITIRNLLGMTSGIYDFTKDAQFLKDFTRNPLLPFSPEDVIEIVKRHEPDFKPGEKVEYADTNYTFLGVILEKVTGRKVEQVIKSEILDPLRLRHTSFPTTPAIPRPFAQGYYAGEKGQGRFRNYTASNPDVAWTAGAMISTLADLRTWAKALATGELLSPATHAAQLQFGAIPNPGGPTIGYGLGIVNFAGFIGHNGAIFGYNTAMFYLPGANATIVIEGNKGTNFSNEATDIFFLLAEYLFPEQLKSTGRQ